MARSLDVLIRDKFGMLDIDIINLTLRAEKAEEQVAALTAELETLKAPAKPTLVTPMSTTTEAVG